MSDLILWLNFFIINLFNLTLEFSSLALTFQLVRMAKTYNFEYIAPYDVIAIHSLCSYYLSCCISDLQKGIKMDQAFDIVPKG